jgi:tRNA pseudouridine55 synthase
VKATHVHGVLVVDKPAGPSSHDIVVIARRSLGTARVGHTGTLDPHASGVLPLVVGQATRLAQHLTSSDKEYEATVRFGLVTDTRDAAGEVIASSGLVPTTEAIERGLERFRGTFEQTPPVYSAKMVAGERSYVRARAGKPVASQAIAVTAYALELLRFDPPCARLRVRCSAGFYVRSLAHDLGEAVGTGAILEHLVRTAAAGFTLEHAVPFEMLVTAPRADLRARVLAMETLLTNLPGVELTADGMSWARHGRELGPRQFVRPLVSGPSLVRLIAPDGRLVGLADRAKTPGFLHPTVIFSYN